MQRKRLESERSRLIIIERELSQTGFGRAAGETVMAWLVRIHARLPAEGETGFLMRIAQLHYRYRFDPAGLSPPEREQLRTLALQWLRRWPQFHTGAR